MTKPKQVVTHTAAAWPHYTTHRKQTILLIQSQHNTSGIYFADCFYITKRCKNKKPQSCWSGGRIRVVRLSIRAAPSPRLALFTVHTKSGEQNSTLSPTAKTIRRRPPRAGGRKCSVRNSINLISCCLSLSEIPTRLQRRPRRTPTTPLLHMSAGAKQTG